MRQCMKLANEDASKRCRDAAQQRLSSSKMKAKVGLIKAAQERAMDVLSNCASFCHSTENCDTLGGQ